MQTNAKSSVQCITNLAYYHINWLYQHDAAQNVFRMTQKMCTNQPHRPHLVIIYLLFCMILSIAGFFLYLLCFFSRLVYLFFSVSILSYYFPFSLLFFQNAQFSQVDELFSILMHFFQNQRIFFKLMNFFS